MTKPTVICIDDEPLLLESLRVELRRELGAEFQIEAVPSGTAALDLVRQILDEGGDVAVVLADEKMPGLLGHEVLAQVAPLCPTAALVLMTGYNDAEAVKDAVATGLYRYLTKPWKPEEIAFTVRQAQLRRQRQALIDDQALRIGRLTKSLVLALETTPSDTDPETLRHNERVTEYAVLLATRSGADAGWVDRLRLYAGLHDIGKVGVVCNLTTQGPYTAEERSLQNLHVAYGARILGAEGIDPMAAHIARYHHERWDGRGYLDHLAGEAIPLEARIVALVDVFDALTSPRPYREALPFDVAFDHVVTLGGSWFDPRLVLVFRECNAELRVLRDRVNGRPLPGPGALPSHRGSAL